MISIQKLVREQLSVSKKTIARCKDAGIFHLLPKPAQSLSFNITAPTEFINALRICINEEIPVYNMFAVVTTNDAFVINHVLQRELSMIPIVQKVGKYTLDVFNNTDTYMDVMSNKIVDSKGKCPCSPGIIIHTLLSGCSLRLDITTKHNTGRIGGYAYTIPGHTTIKCLDDSKALESESTKYLMRIAPQRHILPLTILKHALEQLQIRLRLIKADLTEDTIEKLDSITYRIPDTKALCALIVRYVYDADNTVRISSDKLHQSYDYTEILVRGITADIATKKITVAIDSIIFHISKLKIPAE